MVVSLPVTGDPKSKFDGTKEPVHVTSKSGQKDEICGNKGRFCELICKNNPSEGGKMCK